MGNGYGRPMPCYHGYASHPPTKQPCCRPPPAMIVYTRVIRTKFGPRYKIQRYRRY
jgi:hypothetical protein